MSENLIKQFPKFEMIAAIKSGRVRKMLLAELAADKKFCKALREIVRNTVNCAFTLPLRVKRKLRPYRRVILQLQQKTTHKRRRKCMSQTGTGLFIPLVVPLIANLLSSLLNEVRK